MTKEKSNFIYESVDKASGTDRFIIPHMSSRGKSPWETYSNTDLHKINFSMNVLGNYIKFCYSP